MNDLGTKQKKGSASNILNVKQPFMGKRVKGAPANPKAPSSRQSHRRNKTKQPINLTQLLEDERTIVTPKQIIDSFEASSAGHFQPRMNGNKSRDLKKRNLLP